MGLDNPIHLVFLLIVLGIYLGMYFIAGRVAEGKGRSLPHSGPVSLFCSGQLCCSSSSFPARDQMRVPLIGKSSVLIAPSRYSTRLACASTAAIALTAIL